jgi:hypothetical protein
MDNYIPARDFGNLEATVNQLEKQVERLTTAVDSLTSTVEQARGGWKVIAGIAGASSLITTVALKLLGALKGF